MFSVLYIDDEPGLLEIGKVYLENFGDLSVSTVEKASDALEHLKTGHFDAIISDYQMPEMDGLELLKRVRLSHGHIPFILFTGRGREEVVIRALNLGADFYLQKGGDPSSQFAELAHKIRQAVQRRRMEVALEESESRYRAVIESQTELICRFRPDGVILFVNGAFCTYYGKTMDDLVGKPFRPDLMEEDRDAIRRHLASLTHENPVGSIEHRIRMPDGSIRWQHWTDRAIFDEYGGIAEYQSVGYDFTDRKRAQEALEQSENLYRTVFMGTGAATLIIAPDTTILLANTGWEKLTGMPRTEQEGKISWTVFFNTEDVERMVQYHHDRRKDPSLAPAVYESRLIDVNRNVHHCFVHVHMIPGTKNSVASLVDVTDWKRTEESLRESEKKFRALVEQSMDGIVITDLSGTVLFANRRTAGILGAGSSSDLVRRVLLLDFVVPESRDAASQDFARLVSGEESVQCHYRMRTLKNREFWVECIGQKILFEGSTAVLISLRDISRRKEAEEALEESEARFRVMAEGSPVSIVVFQDDRIIFVNDYTARISGYSKAELYGKNFWELFPPGIGEAIRERGLARQRGERVPGQYEVEMLNRQGERRWAYLSAGRILIGGKGAGIAMLVDITDRKRAEEALRESEAKYRMLVEHSRDGIFIIQDGRLVFYNQALTGLSGYSAEELDGMLLSGLIAPEDQDTVLSRARNRAAGKAVPDRYEVSLLHKDGSRRIRIRISAGLASYQGKPASIGTFYDVTEDRKREEALRESEEKLRSILDNIQDAYYRSDRDGNLIMFSPSGVRLLGYESADGILGKSIAEHIYANPGDRAEFLTALAKRGSVSDYEVNLRRRDGSGVTVSTNSHFWYAPDGSIGGVEGIFRDITEKKQAARELERSEALYRTVFETTGAATILIGPDTLILRANAAMEKLAGIPRAQLEGSLSWTTLIHPEDVALMKEFHSTRRKDAAAAPKVYECRLIDAEKTVHPCLVHVDMIPGTGNSIASLIDITTVKYAEEALRQANRKLNLLTGITRHDIKNQLLVLKGFLKILEMGEKDAALNDFCRKAAASADRISAMIQFTKEYETLGISAPAWQDLRSLVDHEVMQTLPGSITVRCSIPGGLEVLADPLIARVIHNLMDNTLQHGGTVTAIRVSAEERDGSQVIVWEDDGCGVPPDEKDRIFERGYGKHSGLGLALSREILAITGLTIREAGEEGKGARFEITVPRGMYRIAGREQAGTP
jgi:PAS domain S-box-containing protein